MKHLVRTVLLLALAAVLVAPAMAQDGKKKKKKKRPRRGRNALSLPRKLQQSLNDEQKKKIAAIRKEFAPKLQALNKKRLDIVSREKLREAYKARRDAAKAGKKGRELQKVLTEALGLTAEQTEKWQALQKEQRGIAQDFRKKVSELLDENQKKLLRPARKKGKKKKRKKKKDAAE